MTEITWLADLIVNHELAPKTKQHVLKRMKAIEKAYNQTTITHQSPRSAIKHVNGAPQAPSTIALMERHAQAEPQQQGIVAATAATAMAMESRQRAIAQAETGKPDLGRTSPRKF